MKSHVIVFPGSNCDRDIAVAIKNISGHAPEMLWHKETSIHSSDLIVIPGGFSYGDYLRCGAIASTSPIMKDVVKTNQDMTHQKNEEYPSTTVLWVLVHGLFEDRHYLQIFHYQSVLLLYNHEFLKYHNLCYFDIFENFFLQ